jgi:glycogen synthase
VTAMRPAVLQIGTRWFPEFPGGLERYYHDLLRHLPAAGFDVVGLVLGTAQPAPVPGLEIDTYAPPTAPLLRRVRAVRAAAQAQLRRRDLALMVCHYPLYALPVADVMGRLPTLIHFHGPWAAEGRAEGNSVPAWLVKRAIEQLLYRRAAGFIVLSTAFRDVLRDTYGVAEDRIFVIPGGIDLARFGPGLDRAAARRALGLPVDRPILLSIRRLVRRMGLEALIDALPEIAASLPEILLVLAGSGPLRDAIEQRVRRRGLAASVRLLGRVPDEQLPLLYRAADVSIVPSLALEGFGLTTVESLACGTPVLVTPVGGLPEVVRDLAPDLVLGGQGPAALAEGVLGFFGGRLRMPDAAACARYVGERFDWPVVARSVAERYRAVIAGA